MSDKQISVKFSAQGTELASFLENIKKKSADITSMAIQGALAQTDKAKDLLRITEEQIKALIKKEQIEARINSLGRRDISIEGIKGKQKSDVDWINSKKGVQGYTDGWVSKQTQNVNDKAEESILEVNRKFSKDSKEDDRKNKLLADLAKQNIETLKDTAGKNIKAITTGDAKITDILGKGNTDQEKLVERLSIDGVNSKRSKEDGGGKSPSIIGSLLAVDNIKQLLGAAGQLAATENRFDTITPASNLAGRIIGGIIGGVVGTLIEPGIGSIAGAAMGASVGGEFGSDIGAFKQRQAIAGRFYNWKDKGKW